MTRLRVQKSLGSANAPHSLRPAPQPTALAVAAAAAAAALEVEVVAVLLLLPAACAASLLAQAYCRMMAMQR
jgi:hypothetical protein